jgi:hypothetical protein
MRPWRVLASDSVPCLVAVLSLLVGCNALAKEVVNGAAVQKAINQTTVQQATKRLDEFARRKSVGELVAELENLAEKTPSGTIEHEWLLDRGLHALASLQPTPAARAFAARIAQHTPQIFARLDPDHGAHVAPLYDPAATARFVLRNWERAHARNQALAALDAQQSSPLDRFAQNDAPIEVDAIKSGIADAYRAANIDALAQQRHAIIALLQGGARVDELAAIAAERLQDAELYRLVLNHADGAVALKQVRRVRRVLGEAAALDVLITASDRPEISSATVLEIGRIAQQDVRARDALMNKLDDAATGPSAAAALGGLQEANVVAALGRRLAADTSEPGRTHAALALKLNRSPAARAQLEQFLKSSSGSARLRNEVRAWLAD